jgi:hypothetical protein
MYIRKLQIKDLKLLRDVTIDFTRDEEPRMWTVFVGENGLCKTTVLQAIALAASGPDRANQLADILSLPDRRKSKPECVIKAQFSLGSIQHAKRHYPGLDEPGPSPPRVDSSLRLKPGWKVFHGESHYADEGLLPEPPVDPLQVVRGEGSLHWFIAGYGVERSLPVPQRVSPLDDPVFDRLTSLFAKGTIVGTGFADLFDKTTLVHDYSRRLQQALVQDPVLLPKITNLELRGRGGVKQAKHLVESHRFSFRCGNKPVKVPATWLSQGYQGLIAWVADLIGQQFWDTGSKPELHEMEGLVLVDELDLFLHPSWQIVLVRALKETFPKMQFVVTTHSPMLLPGFEMDEIRLLEQDEQGNVCVLPAKQSPLLMTGSEIYRVFFGVEGLYPTKAGELLQQYGYISSNPRRTDADDDKMRRLRKELVDVGIEPDWDPVPRETTG